MIGLLSLFPNLIGWEYKTGKICPVLFRKGNITIMRGRNLLCACATSQRRGPAPMIQPRLRSCLGCPGCTVAAAMLTLVVVQVGWLFWGFHSHSHSARKPYACTLWVALPADGAAEPASVSQTAEPVPVAAARSASISTTLLVRLLRAAAEHSQHLWQNNLAAQFTPVLSFNFLLFMSLRQTCNRHTTNIEDETAPDWGGADKFTTREEKHANQMENCLAVSFPLPGQSSSDCPRAHVCRCPCRAKW